MQADALTVMLGLQEAHQAITKAEQYCASSKARVLELEAELIKHRCLHSPVQAGTDALQKISQLHTVQDCSSGS